MRFFGRVGFGDPEARFLSLLGHSLFSRAGTVGSEVQNFLYSALPSVGSVLLTLRHRCCVVFFMVKPILWAWRHDFDPFG